MVKKSTSQRFACKIFSRKLISEHSDLKELVHNEIHIHRQLKHERIVAFIESFGDIKHVYIIQYLCSSSLETLKIKRGAVSIAVCRYYVYQILQGVRYIHEKGFIHRDLKLGNILLNENGQVKICDFGLTCHIDDAHSLHMICGTRSYMAPEVFKWQGFTKRSDIWAIGVISFVLVFGFNPFRHGYATDKIDQFLTADSRLIRF